MASSKDHRHMPKGNMNTANSLVGISSLKEGSYSEAESHNGFLEALNAWRVAGGKKDDSGATASAKSSKKVKFTDVQAAWDHQQDPAKKGSFFANIDAGNNNFDLGAIPTW